MSNPKTPAEYSPVGIVGVGNMGLPMATYMIKAGFTVFGTDLFEGARKALESAGGTAFTSAGDIGSRCRYIVLSMPAADSLQSVCNELSGACKAATVIAETSTLPIYEKIKARDLLSEKGIILLDSTLSGTSEQARNRDIVSFGSGDKNAFDEFIPIIESYSRAYYYLGEFGNGMKMKLIANQLVAIHNVAAAEAVLFAQRLGMDPDLMVRVISNSAGTSRMFEVRAPHMVNRTWNKTQISNNLFHKDVSIIDEALYASGCPSPLFSATKPLYTAAVAAGYGDDDTAAVYAVLEQMSKPPK